jgi:hypothetical protein
MVIMPMMSIRRYVICFDFKFLGDTCLLLFIFIFPSPYLFVVVVVVVFFLIFFFPTFSYYTFLLSLNFTFCLTRLLQVINFSFNTLARSY